MPRVPMTEKTHAKQSGKDRSEPAEMVTAPGAGGFVRAIWR
jgi:hypothetical protein